MNKKKPSIIGELSNEFEITETPAPGVRLRLFDGEKIWRRKTRDIVRLTLWNFSKNPAAVPAMFLK